MIQNREKLFEALADPNRPIYVKADGSMGGPDDTGLLGIIPKMPVSSFGSPAFKEEYGLKYAYVGGAMVGGITSQAMVRALAEAGCLGMFGASGLAPARVEEEIAALSRDLGDKPFGSCLIHTPQDPSWEEKVSEIYLKHKVRVIEASAFMQITPSLVRYRLSGLAQRPDGTVYAPNRIMAKVSRVELARRFFSPPPEKMVAECLKRGWVTADEAALAPRIPLACDLTAEADSGGHTDFRPALPLWAAMVNAAAEATEKFAYAAKLRVGGGGGIGTPWAVAAARQVGLAYLVTGSINQSCVESGLAPAGRELLTKAGQADVVQGPAADMFELGAKVQVLKFGTLYAMRAQKLAEAYRLYDSMDDIPQADRESLETQVFKQTLAETWEQTRAFFKERDPEQAAKAESDPKFKMALVFRWYLGQASRWAIGGVEDRRTDWQIFCGPAQGAFNEWAKGTIYEGPDNRKVADLAMNLLYGAAVIARCNLAVDLGAVPFGSAPPLKPRPLAEIKKYLD
ncbi:PfaD family polyunsaturated fatty acid/polyketide biosynthesis protein [Deltaproteobacteria bacterium OttesenSCG-928-K17]|nr:PfaD family polyunsaturated fatty acid/polyketide biosynthesis protein [Deltaproteobacteria bacterium OttesenSCG-928-K17]